MEIAEQTRIAAQNEVKDHDAMIFVGYSTFRDRAFERDLFRFDVVWDGACRFHINDCFFPNALKFGDRQATSSDSRDPKEIWCRYEISFCFPQVTATEVQDDGGESGQRADFLRCLG